MAAVDEDGERAIIEDEDDIEVDIESDEEDDDQWDFDDEEDGRENLYDSPLDDVDEVLYFCEKMQNLEQNGNQEFHSFLMSQLGP